MNIIDEIKALFKVRSVAKDVIKEITMPTPGWKTSEFWLNLASQAAVLFSAVKGFIPANIATIVSIAGVAVYTVARTIVKAVSDIKAAKTPTPA